MAQPTYAKEPRKPATTKNDHPGRSWGILLLLGGLAGIVISLTHPQGHPVAHATEFPAWTAVHMIGAIGFGLIAIAALIQLTTGNAPNRAGITGLAALTLFGVVAMIAMAVDGFLNPALASIQGETGATAITTAFLSAEQAFASFGYGGFGIAGALVVASHIPRMGTPMRIASGIAIAALLAFAGAGILYIGMGISALGPLFASGIFVFAYFTLWGARLSFGRVPSPTQNTDLRTRTA